MSNTRDGGAAGPARERGHAKALRMKVRLYNNRLVRAREELGLSQGAAAMSIGVSVHTLMRMETLQYNPLGQRGWTDAAGRVAEFYGLSPDYLWSDEIAVVRKSVMEIEMSSREATCLVGEELDAGELRARLLAARSRLLESGRLSHMALRMLDARVVDGRSYGSVGSDYRLGRERARQIVDDAIRAMRRELTNMDKEERRLSQGVAGQGVARQGKGPQGQQHKHEDHTNELP